VGVLGGHVCGTQWGRGEQEEGNLAGRQEERWWTGKMSRGRQERGAEATQAIREVGWRLVRKGDRKDWLRWVGTGIEVGRRRVGKWGGRGKGRGEEAGRPGDEGLRRAGMSCRRERGS
jgi:hypothetical protein